MTSTTAEQMIQTQEGLFVDQYDEANALMLPSSRVKSLEKGKNAVKLKKKQKCLTKNQRKALEKIVKRRNDKKNRVELLNELNQHALPEATYKSLTPLVQVQQIMKCERKAKNKLKHKKSLNPPKLEEELIVHEQIEDSDSDLSSLSDHEMEIIELKTVREGNDSGQSAVLQDQDILDVSDSVQSEISATTPLPEQKIKKVECKKIKINDTRSLKCVIPTRTKEIESIRSKLPIIGEEQVIMEAVIENLVFVLAGETGSGKTTQVPQFLYEAGYASNGKIIGVTEPRRIAAIAMSQRVSKELNVAQGIVSYQIRFEGNTSKKTKIKFMTDGVLLKEMEKDFLLNNYSVICIDEAHERSLYTDILIGLLSRTVRIRQKKKDPLRVIIMSATMRVEDFTDNTMLFKTSPAFIEIPVRQHPVHIHFNKVTPENYLDAARKKVAKIHSSLPDGGILVFVTGQEEVKRLVKLLTRMFPSSTSDSGSTPKKGRKRERANVRECPSVAAVSEFDLSELPAFPSRKSENANDSSDEDDIGEDVEEIKSCDPILVIPLYSMLSIKEQEKIFAPAPPGVRVCVVATNVAETSLTIPGIRYVVDCGKVKLKLWDKLTGVQKYEVTWCSKASARQRAGRAGRTGPGNCYRLFSSAVYHSEFNEYSVPEIAVRPVDDMVLLMKSMSINQVRDFPYPTHPGDDQLVAAENLLVLLGALEIPLRLAISEKNDRSRITALGKTMAYLPVSPRFSKMLATSFPHGIVEYVITLVAALSVQEVLLDSDDDETRKKYQQIRRKWGGTGTSLLLGDCMVLLRAVGAFEFEGGTYESAVRLGLRYKSMVEIRKLRKKLTADINLVVSSQETLLNPQMKPPTPEQSDILRQIILSGCPDRIAKLITPEEITGDTKKQKHGYWCGDLEEPAFIYESSVLRGTEPEWIVYQESFEFNGRIFLKGVTAIDPDWIPIVCPVLCKRDNPLINAPHYIRDICK